MANIFRKPTDKEELRIYEEAKEEALILCSQENLVLSKCYRSWKATFTGCVFENEKFWKCFKQQVDSIRKAKTELRQQDDREQ